MKYVYRSLLLLPALFSFFCEAGQGSFWTYLKFSTDDGDVIDVSIDSSDFSISTMKISTPVARFCFDKNIFHELKDLYLQGADYSRSHSIGETLRWYRVLTMPIIGIVDAKEIPAARFFSVTVGNMEYVEYGVYTVGVNKIPVWEYVRKIPIASVSCREEN